MPKGIHISSTHILSKDGVELKIQLKLFKAIPELWIEKEQVELKKLRRKELREVLIGLQIHNEINPRVLPKEPYDYKQLITPVILVLCGSFWHYFTNHLGRFWWIPSALFLVIGYFQLISPLVDKIPDEYIDDETRGKLKLLISIVGMILTQESIRIYIL